MDRLEILIVLLATICLFGCGGQAGPALTSTGPTSPPATTQTPTAANWQFDTATPARARWEAHADSTSHDREFRIAGMLSLEDR